MNGQSVIKRLAAYGLFDFLSDEAYLKVMFRIYVGRKLNLDHPKSYNEKLQWLKLYNHRPEYITMVDKYRVRGYIAQTIGEKYLIPLIGVWDNADEIDFASLPDQFVLKCNHDSGSIVICQDKKTFNIDEAKRKLNNSLKNSNYRKTREWPYKDVKRKIICEKYMEDSATKELRDYKFFCFDGEIKALFVACDRQKGGESVKFDYFDRDYHHLDMMQDHPLANKVPEKPQCFEEMKKCAEQLSKGIPHVRVDFYEVDGKVYFGELTFFHHSGFVPFKPEEWDYMFGEWLRLPAKT